MLTNSIHAQYRKFDSSKIKRMRFFHNRWYNLFYDVECQFFQERTLIVCPSVVIPVSAIFIISTRGKSCLRENTNWVTNVTKK